jgi:hypothetical protein
MILGQRKTHEGAAGQVLTAMLLKPKSLPARALVLIQNQRAGAASGLVDHIIRVSTPQVQPFFVHVD